MYLIVIMLILIYASLYVISDYIGYIISFLIYKENKNNNNFLLFPIVGISLIIICSSTSFVLLNNSLLGFIPLILLAIFLSISYIKSLDISNYIKQSIKKCLLVLTTIILATIPYIVTNGFRTNITGYYINNDSVIHGLLSRNCYENVNLREKMYTTNFFNNCLLFYPIGGHSVVNVISHFVPIDTTYLIFITNLYFISLTALPIYSLISRAKIGKRKIIHFFISVLSPATYYSLAIAYHGFSPQTIFVPLLLTASYTAQHYVKVFDIQRSWILESILFAASILVYGFVAVIPITGVVCTKFMRTMLVNRKQDYSNILVSNFRTALLTLFLSFVVTVPTIWKFSENYILHNQNELENIDFKNTKGNLIEEISPFIGSGIWFESDYRLLKMDKFNGIHYYTSIVIVLISVIFLIFKANRTVKLVFISMIAAHLINYLLIGSPYTLTKTYSLISPLLAMGFLLAVTETIRNKKIYTIIFVLFFIGSQISNLILLKNISTYPNTGIIAMKQINSVIGNKETLIYSDNDWLVYYVDSPTVDITELHYLPDKNINLNKHYEYVVFEGDRKEIKDYSCTDTQKYYNFTLCQIN